MSCLGGGPPPPAQLDSQLIKGDTRPGLRLDLLTSELGRQGFAGSLWTMYHGVMDNRVGNSKGATVVGIDQQQFFFHSDAT